MTTLNAVKKELEDKILKFMRDKVCQTYRDPFNQPPMWVYIRDIYLGVNASSYGDASIFNSVLKEMGKAGIFTVQGQNIALSEDQDKEMLALAQPERTAKFKERLAQADLHRQRATA
jgi:hypothetical protein